MKRIIFWSAIMGTALFVLASILAGVQMQDYDIMGQYISESYARGMPHATYFQYAFMASGILLALFGFGAPSNLPKSRATKTFFYLFAVFYGLGTVLTGIFPCDIGCEPDPINPTASQFIHNLSGALTYMVVPFCLIGLGITLKKWPNIKALANCSLLCGILSMVFVLLLFGDSIGPFKGLYQRIIESNILFWVTYCAFYILKTPKNPVL